MPEANRHCSGQPQGQWHGHIHASNQQGNKPDIFSVQLPWAFGVHPTEGGGQHRCGVYIKDQAKHQTDPVNPQGRHDGFTIVHHFANMHRSMLSMIILVILVMIILMLLFLLCTLGSSPASQELKAVRSFALTALEGFTNLQDIINIVY